MLAVFDFTILDSIWFVVLFFSCWL